MKAKKNSKKDVNKGSGIFFALGMLLVLALTYVSLEWKTFSNDAPLCSIAMLEEDNIMEEPIVITLPEPPKPKPIITPPIIEIVVDETELPETPIELIDPNPDTEIAKVKDINFAPKDEDIDVDFIRVEQVPIFPGCEKKEDKRACFNEKMSKHIRKNFRYPEIAQEMNIQGKVYVRFVIQKDGSIANLQLRGPDVNLTAEAARIVDKLPKMTPGKQRGTPVRVPFNLPISFKLN